MNFRKLSKLASGFGGGGDLSKLASGFGGGPGIFPGIPQDAGGGIRRRGQTGGIRDAGKISRKFRKAPEGRLEVSQDPGEIRTENRGAAGSETLISLR